MIENVSLGVLERILDTLPIEISFVDKDDTVRYFNRESGNRIFYRQKTVVGLKVQNCHPKESLHKVEEILNDFKGGKRDVAEFWIDLRERKIYIRYFAVWDNRRREYLGCLEVIQDITNIQKITGEKRLL